MLLAAATAWERHKAALIYGSISYRPGYTYTQYPDVLEPNSSKMPRFTLFYTKAIAGLWDGKADFDKWRFTVRDDIRLRLLGTLKYNLGVGGFLNTRYVSLPDAMQIEGNRGVGYASAYMVSYQFAQYYEFANSSRFYGEAHLEYHLKGLLSNKIPLLKQARYYLVCGANLFYSAADNHYNEAFVGIDNIGWKLLRAGRLDFVQSWDSRGGRISGVRFGIDLPGFNTPKASPSGSEW